jgi:hypothetical protein
MKKIVIVSSQQEPDYSLLALINMFFPDCEIQIVLSEVEAFEQCQADSSSGLFTTDTIGRASWQIF